MQKTRLPGLALCFVMIGALGACADTNLVKDAAVAVGIGSEPRPAPDFVARSRPATYEFLPVGPSAPKRLPAKDAAGLAKAEAEMDASRTLNEARGAAARKAAGSTPPAEPVPAPRSPPAE
jgi:hypothetical protein